MNLKSLLVLFITAILWIQISGQTIKDSEGNVYEIVTIGNQVWMKENLRTTRYNNNTSIANVKDSTAWSNLTTSAYCDWGNDPEKSAVYGALYNWYVIDNPQEVCPSGWHVPSDSEWAILAAYLGGDSIAGSHLKETGNKHWLYKNADADNTSGFTALPSGHRHRFGSFATLGYYGFFWSSTKTDSVQAFNRFVSNNSSAIGRSSSEYTNGFSIRCICDLSSQIKNNSHSRMRVPEIQIDCLRRNVIFVGSYGKEGVMSIFNCSGQSILRKKFKPGMITLDVGFLPKGSYVLCVSYQSSSITKVFFLY